MSSAAPDWDLLVAANDQDAENHIWFPAAKVRMVNEFLALEGLRFRNVYLTSKAIEKGSYPLFQILYFNARISGGKVLHSSDFEGD